MDFAGVALGGKKVEDPCTTATESKNLTLLFIQYNLRFADNSKKKI